MRSSSLEAEERLGFSRVWALWTQVALAGGRDLLAAEGRGLGLLGHFVLCAAAVCSLCSLVVLCAASESAPLAQRCDGVRALGCTASDCAWVLTGAVLLRRRVLTSFFLIIAH